MPPIVCLSLKTMQPAEVPSACVLCLGNFDGVHVAHRALMHQAKKLRAHRFSDAACGVFCFDPPSSDFFTDSPAHLCTREEKLARFYEVGMEYAFLADFSNLREYSPKQFVDEILIEYCHAIAAVCGFNYRFGHKGAGDAKSLAELLDAPVEVCEEYRIDGCTVSSSRIRNHLKNGEAKEATKLLLHPYSLYAPVLHGKALGRTWGFPTVNQQFPKDALVPRHGVYVTDCTLPDGRVVRGVTNVGNRPTVDQNAAINCETHLIDFDGDLYDEALTVSFLHFIRPEQKFESPEALKAQIAKDLQAAKVF